MWNNSYGCVLFGQVTPPASFTEAEKKVLTEKIQNAGTVVVEAKAGKGSATLSMVKQDFLLPIAAMSYAPNSTVKIPIFFTSGIRCCPHGRISPFGPEWRAQHLRVRLCRL
jgi:hypothetical protein